MNAYSKDMGLLGEELAVYYLKSLGYDIVKRNYRTRYGEIDIIAKEGDAIIFVEVKLRRGMKYGYAEENLSLKQQSNIFLSANIYLEGEGFSEGEGFLEEEGFSGMEMRIDYIVMQIESGKFRLNHIKNAFDESVLDGE